MSRFWKRLSTPDWAWLRKINQDEQTRVSWAKRIESYDGLPAVYRAFFANREKEGQEFPYTVLVPAFEGFLRRSPEKLVCGLGDGIAVLEKSGEGCQVSIFPYPGICRIEWREALLEASLQVSGYTWEGDYASASLRFNAVSDYLLQPLVERMRRQAADIEMGGETVDASQFEGWAQQSYKFMNYARRSLLPGEKLVQAIFQPEILKPVASVLGRTFYRTLAPAQAVILAERELVLIREEHRRGGRERYGGVWDYLPLEKIEKMSLEEKNGGLLSLAVQLSEQGRLECTFEASRRQEVEAMREWIQERVASSLEG